ncbi:hypothetical protein FT663_05266 [Candidozyma haemuli var. vulneris]|uniref:Uncharacterized protein n=1 Tax=Candidozyma haemuli TaxID=45357 RepID=A0A2V1B0V5_9ASCO|nr:hypothetical protein CXQ85_004068 [[Candida] haemuloni]KAF3985492.1 hypothetical protein FT662_05115 [[Candida] haemuloni var. vulneris]KAF3985514.1 hypothetical protein FT663_05266 [[Candida] haemuloni var. vulneris]PVH23775.1 hypothetical protein CXQ85_004068 [[Candida] haemuloni]
MSKPQKPVRQDYIAKARYINNLPPPPLNPKFLKYNLTEHVSAEKESEQLLSSLFRKENFTQFIGQVDEEYGMPLNLLHNEGFLDGSNETAIFGSNSSVPLHPKDRILLRDAGIGRVNKSEPGVSFLRRTEYIAENKAANKAEENAVETKKEQKELVDPDSQLTAVEESFDHAQDTLSDLSKIKHPRRKNLRAVSAWPLLPDTSMMDTKYLSIKFSGSASLFRELQSTKRLQKDAYDEQLQQDSLTTAIYKPITSEDGEWVSFYQAKDKKALASLKDKLQSTDREQPSNLLDEEEQDLESYSFAHHKNYDMIYHRFNKPDEELALRFVPEETGSKKRKAAYYYPISGRVELKKHRASTNTEINRFLRDSTYDVIDLKVREPNTSELKRMDNIRSEYDPMEYEGEDEEDEEEEEEADGEANGQDGEANGEDGEQQQQQEQPEESPEKESDNDESE